MTDVSDEIIQRAIARLEAKAGYTLTCGACLHTAPVPDDPAKSAYTCDQCGAQTVYGVEQPRVSVNPHVDRRFVCATFTSGCEKRKSEVTITLERRYAAAVALELLSVTLPQAKYAALAAAMNAALDVPGAPRDPGEIATLDHALPPPGGQPPFAPPGGPVGRPADAEAPGGPTCGCGAPSRHQNGSCEACYLRALGLALG